MSNNEDATASVLCDLEVSARYRSTYVNEPGDEHIVPHDFQLITQDGIVVGRMLADLVCASEIGAGGLHMVCDGDSSSLLNICEALFDQETGDLREELNPNDDHVSRFLFIHRSVFLPCVSAATRQAMLHRIGSSVLNYDDLIVGWSSLCELTASEMKELGYVRVAGTGMVFCHLTRRNPYSDFYEREGTVPVMEVVLPATAAKDFEELWFESCDEIPEY